MPHTMTGPKGGKYHMKNGKKVYHKKKRAMKKKAGSSRIGGSMTSKKPRRKKAGSSRIGGGITLGGSLTKKRRHKAGGLSKKAKVGLGVGLGSIAAIALGKGVHGAAKQVKGIRRLFGKK